MKTVLVLIYLTRLLNVNGNENVIRKFPENFKFGVSTSAHQTEGAWNVDGKGESIWDRMAHTQPESISDRSTADVACNSYYLYKRDIEMLRELGVDFYRLSISWPRILPTGFKNNINRNGINYYNNVINELLKYNITPFVTLYHWDLPQKLQDIGGWMNPIIAEYFKDYAQVAFENFGDRVKDWITINEIPQICINGYARDIYAPRLNMSGIGNYICGHNVLLAHAKAWHLYNSTYRSVQKGRIGITLFSNWVEPLSNSTEDLEIAERGMQFTLGWQAHPIFTQEGDYPQILKETVKQQSMSEGYARSRLPEFTNEEINLLKGTSDFFGLNHYSSILYLKNPKWLSKQQIPSLERDIGYQMSQDPSWPLISPWFAVNPIGIRKLFNWIKNEYNNPEVIITENGYLTHGGIVDLDRVRYLQQNLINIQSAILDDDCNITGYSVWSLMDNYEWQEGYTMCFGLYEVDFNDSNRTRTPRISSFVYRDVIKSKSVDLYFVPNITINNSALFLESSHFLIIKSFIIILLVYIISF